MKRWALIMTASVLSIGVTLLVLLNVGHWLAGPRTVPEQADLIVALGGSAGSSRLQSALYLYREGYAKHILLTGFARDPGALTSHDHHQGSKLLLDGGVTSDALIFDDRSRNSYEEANNTALLMKDRHWKTALVISDPPHLRRLAMVWGTACSQHGLEYHLIATESPTWNASRWWYDKVWAKFVGMELLKLSYYAMAY